MEIKFVKLRENAIIPNKAYKGDAGLDLYFASTEPKNDKEHRCDIIINPGESKLLGTGLKFYFSQDYFVLIRNRSGMAAKKNLVVGAEIVDAGYAGEVFVNLHNIGNAPRIISDGDKIAQFVVLPNYSVLAEEISDIEYNELMKNSERKDGALGSSDKK